MLDLVASAEDCTGTAAKWGFIPSCAAYRADDSKPIARGKIEAIKLLN
jgi:hypothetical protein